MSVPAGLAALSLAIWAYLALGRGFFWRVDLDQPVVGAKAPIRWPGVVAVVPARDEAAVVGRAVASLLGQRYGGSFRVVLVDDNSRDGTADVARAAAAQLGVADRLEVVAGAALPEGWSGKLWAMEQGLRHVARHHAEAEAVLLTDADIEHHAENLTELATRLVGEDRDLVSLMVRLHCRTFAERALIPAFVFFFAMLYPFAWVGDRRRSIAAAAGGCMLVRAAALKRIDGLQKIRRTLIDDCALAREVKRGGSIWLGLSDRTVSLRVYPTVGDIWKMIARTAFTQLGYSWLLLAGTLVGMGLTYAAPPVLALFAGGPPALLGALAWLLMSLVFLPMVRFYRLSPLWAPALPLIALVYLGATLDSARRHAMGRGGEWKGRVENRGVA